ncbi:MAG: hypothetical protein DME24_10390 [Verrucomicrobia bacterium]|nr:MAG: hypothetical protein DME24_10390 [Verrucomicrobiota bacterium]
MSDFRIQSSWTQLANKENQTRSQLGLPRLEPHLIRIDYPLRSAPLAKGKELPQTSCRYWRIRLFLFGFAFGLPVTP